MNADTNEDSVISVVATTTATSCRESHRYSVLRGSFQTFSAFHSMKTRGSNKFRSQYRRHKDRRSARYQVVGLGFYSASEELVGVQKALTDRRKSYISFGEYL